MSALNFEVPILKQGARGAFELDMPVLQGLNLTVKEIDTVSSLASARTSQECNEIFWKASKQYEVGKFASGEIDLQKRQRIVFFGMQWTDAWRAFYLKNDYLERDPLLRFVDKTEEPFTWQELLKTSRLTEDERGIFREVSKHGWVDGFVLPIPRSGSHIGLVSVVCRAKLAPLTDKPFLTALSFCYHERMRAVLCSREFPIPPMGLTPRESECLKLVAAGYSDKAIGVTLNISTATAHQHVQGAMRRIGVNTRHEAVAIATAFGIFRPC